MNYNKKSQELTKMKGIGKLIELLNEYEGYSKDAFNRWRYDEYGYITEGGDYLYIGTEQKIISKRFGFIRRLVERDLIDFKNEKIYENPSFTAIKYGALLTKEGRGRTAREEEEIIKNGFIDALIMLLAIQENPIEFLIGLLK